MAEKRISNYLLWLQILDDIVVLSANLVICAPADINEIEIPMRYAQNSAEASPGMHIIKQLMCLLHRQLGSHHFHTSETGVQVNFKRYFRLLFKFVALCPGRQIFCHLASELASIVDTLYGFSYLCPFEKLTKHVLRAVLDTSSSSYNLEITVLDSEIKELQNYTKGVSMPLRTIQIRKGYYMEWADRDSTCPYLGCFTITGDSLNKLYD
ncbi:hypothetical protein CBL_07974 [Carabus blaptoides fortunei]